MLMNALKDWVKIRAAELKKGFPNMLVVGEKEASSELFHLEEDSLGIRVL
ncbi:MAG: hypothetical protein Ct9H90mP20_7460 [Candidatus Neomarinimicrobiota bacterium]|nr:MAG: hypothetical protein Ct9H90mP20_7460 [Candidatus Neomarinimicrobiota bacterium]